MIKHPLATTPDGTLLYVDLLKSPASDIIAYQPYIVILIKELVQNVKMKVAETTVEYDFGRPIGSCDIVSTTEKDHIMYAKPVNRDTFYRFVRRRQPEATNFITVTVRRQPEGDYELLDAWFGKNRPELPGSENENPSSRQYWESHAIVLEGHPIQNRTLTLTCPF
jgi:hypothetical protein